MSGTVTLDIEKYNEMVETIRKYKADESTEVKKIKERLDAITKGGALSPWGILTNAEVTEKFNKELDKVCADNKAEVIMLYNKIERLRGRSLFQRIFNEEV